MISLSTSRTKQKVLAWRPWEQSKLKQDGVREVKHFTLLPRYIKYAWGKEFQIDLRENVTALENKQNDYKPKYLELV